MANILDKVIQRSEEYRPIPFWSWNDKLQEDLSAWQIDEMAKAGLGGYFMHARGGIQTEYLSEEWFQHIEVGIKEGIAKGMNPWLYDESGWPSGFAGGAVTAKGEYYHAKGLALEYIEDLTSYQKDKNFLSFYSLDKETNQVNSYNEGEEIRGQLIAVKYTVCPDYIDILNHEVIKVFIACTHERYYERFKAYFGTGIQGFFTDEPRISEGDVPWSHLLPEEFSKRYGYNLIDHLPALFIACTGYEAVRYDFWAMISDLFVTAFMKQIYDWCEEHACKLTGHVMMEESLYSQMTGTTGSMPFYEYMHMPGVDWLRRTMGNSIMAKQVGSVADQLGKMKVLTESYALCGWDVSLEELKWLAEWQYMNGVNVMCQHLEGYTLRGFRKRDYPPSLFFQQAWWNEYKDFNDYLARLGAVLTEGKKQIDVLVIHPMKSAWLAYDGKNNKTIKTLDQDLTALTEALLGSHIDYHFGDETLMKAHAKIENGKFVLGECAYNTVILPHLLTLDEYTVTLLEDFLEAGGNVIGTGAFPKLCNGRISKSLLQLEEKVESILQLDLLGEKIKAYLEHPISISQKGQEVQEIRCMQRELETSRLIYMANLNKEETYQTVIKLKGDFKAQLLSLEKMNITDKKSCYENGFTQIELTFAPMQSYLLLITTQAEEKESELLSLNCEKINFNTNTWQIEKMDYNALTLDQCKYRIDRGEWQESLPVIHVMKHLLELKRPCEIELDFKFAIETDLADIGDLYLIAEEAEAFEIVINEQIITYTDEGWWKDTSFKKVDIRPYIKEGENHIYLTRNFYQSPKVYHVLFDEGVYETEFNQLTYDVELESIYLLGDFGVMSQTGYTELPRKALRTKGEFVVVRAPKVLELGDFTTQGLCFFAGKLSLSRTFNSHKKENSRVILDLGRINAAMLKLYINGKFITKFMWEPFQVDVTEFIQEGENLIGIEIYSSNRNLLGPHHHIDGEIYNVGPMSFTGEWSWCERPTEGVEISEEDKTKSYWRDDYCFVKFGLYF